MRVLITGNMGYIGPVVTRQLRRSHPGADLTGVDSGWFAHCLTTRGPWPDLALNRQIYGDVRDVTQADLQGIDCVIVLSAVSNDPMGNRFEAVTDAINEKATVRMAELAARAGVRNFVFASSCSIYGYAAEGGARREGDPVNPLTAYARSKIGTESALAVLDTGMAITCLRFATACGMSERLRLDLVLNDFVACALASKEITVLSDGTPWRPLIHVRDMARAIDWAATRDASDGGRMLRVNVGSDEWNYQVKDLAHAVARAVPGTTVSINTAAPPDKRSYRVDFGLFKQVAPNHRPLETLEGSIAELRDHLQELGFADRDFRNSQLIRLKVLDRHISSGRLNEQLRWAA